MPCNGETNKTFGVYRSFCCGTEIVISEGAKFPDCPRHIRLTTKWKLVSDTDHGPHASLLDSMQNTGTDAA
jgi:hypothetical protein